MAEAVGLSLNTSFLKRLEEADKLYQQLIDKNNNLSSTTVKAFETMTQKGIAPYVESLKEQKVALEGVAKVRLGKNATQEMRDMKDSAKAAVKEINKLIDSLTRTKQYKAEASGTTAISFSRNIIDKGGDKSINNMERALSKMRDAQNRLNLNTIEGRKAYKNLGKEISNVERELEKAKGANELFINSGIGTGKMLNAVFSVAAIRGFVNQLVTIRGEFELQHKSLQVLLQDVDKANELWDKTIALAVKSPYRVKELVTYTKQLAAYRVESEKLYDTTRMLADVSAGLGVDMNRLILAFGQVKAANFLRGTELRQFSEAGVNLLEELSKRFTQLEGRVVSVGDVFDRVSKRMVKFADVEAVFQTITSEGGVFYKMQEKQSETLRGMIMNLKDSIDLMFNELGSSNEGIIKGALILVRNLIDDWQSFIPVVKTLGIAMFAAFSTRQILSFANAVHSTIRNVRRLGVAMSMLKSMNVWASLAALVAGVVVHLVNARKKVDELTMAMNNVDKDINKQLEDMILLYRTLAERVRDVTISEKEREKALSNLKNKFGEILPDQLLELEYIQNISDNYDQATESLMNYYNTKAIEQKKDKAETEYGEDIDKEVATLQKRFNKLLDRSDNSIWSNDEDEAEAIKVKLRAYSSDIINSVVLSAKEGLIELDDIGNVIKQKLSSFVGIPIESIEKAIKAGGTKNFALQIEEIKQVIFEYRGILETIDGLQYENLEQKEAADIFLPQKENIEKAKELFKTALNEFSQLSQQTVGSWKGADEDIRIMLNNLPPEMMAYAELLSKMFEKMKTVAAQGSFEFGKSIQGFQQEFTLGLADAMWSQTIPNMATFVQDESGQWETNIKEELVQLVTNIDNTLRDEVARLNLNDFQKSVVEAMKVIAQKTGQSVNEFTDFIPKMGDSLSTTREAVEAEIALLESRITTWTNSMKVEAPELISARPGALGETQASIDKATKLIEMFKMLRNFLGGADKKKEKTDNTIEERIKVVDQMNKKYLELKKTLSDTDALQGAFDAYKDAFATAYGREDVRDMKVEDFIKNVLNFPDENKIIEWFDKLAATVTDKEDKFKVQFAKGKFEMDIQVRDKKDLDKQLEKDIQDMFDEYDISLELKKLNIPPDLAQSLFGVKSTDLKDIRKKIEDELTAARAEKGNEDRIKQLEKDLEKVNDMEDKAQIERLKTYLQYTRDAIGERAKIKVEEMTKLQEIDETFTKAMSEAKTEEDKQRIEEQKKLAQEGVKREASEKTERLDWEDFKSSDTFINLFNDLDNASNDLINHTITRIQKFKDEWTDMPVESAKEMALKLNELQLALMNTDRPLKDNKKLWAELSAEMEKRGIEGRPRNARAQAALTEKVTSETKDYEIEIEMANKRIAVLQTINNLNAENKAQELEKRGYTKEYVETLGLSEKVLTNTVEVNNDLIKEEKGQIKSTNDKIAANRKVLNTQKKISQNYQELNDAIGTSKKLANDLYNSFKELTEVLGGDGPAMIFADMGMSMANTVLDTVMLIVQMNAATIAAQGLGAAMKSASGIIGWIVMAIELLVQAISAAVNYAEKMRQMKLDVLAAQVDNLKQKYDALAESIDQAYSTKQLQEYSKELDRLHDKMKDAQEDYITLLESGKDGDTIDLAKQAQEKLDQGFAVDDLSKKERKALLSEEYKDYKEATDTLAKIEKDHEEQKRDLLESMGGVTDYKDAAQDFVDAWVDAFRETGDGLSGLQENFREFFDNVIKQEAMRRVTDKYMQPFFDDLNAALNEGHGLNEAEIKDLKAQAEKVAPELNKVLEELWMALGGSRGDAEGGGLSALQKGVQGITEDTAQVIEAYLNSIRGYVSEQVTHTRNIYRILNDAVHSDAAAIRVRMV